MRGFPVESREFEAGLGRWWNLSNRLGHVVLVLPVDVSLDLGFIEPDGGNEIPHAPDALFLKVQLSHEFDALAEGEAGGGFQFSFHTDNPARRRRRVRW